KRSLPCAADRGDVPALSRREALRDRGTQALDVDEAAPLRIEHVAQGLAAVLARAGRLERDVHPAGIGPLRRVVALADQLVELEVALDPARELERGHPGDLDVGGLAGAVLARALPARGLLLQRPLEPLAAIDAVRAEAPELVAQRLQHLAAQVHGGAHLARRGEGVVDAQALRELRARELVELEILRHLVAGLGLFREAVPRRA